MYAWIFSLGHVCADRGGVATVSDRYNQIQAYFDLDLASYARSMRMNARSHNAGPKQTNEYSFDVTSSPKLTAPNRRSLGQSHNLPSDDRRPSPISGAANDDTPCWNLSLARECSGMVGDGQRPRQ